MKLLKTFFTLCLVAPVVAQAALVQQNISGTVTSIDASYDGTATLSTMLGGFVIYDDELVDNLMASQVLELDFEPGSVLSLDFNGQSFSLSDDIWFGSGGPLATFELGIFTGIDFATEIASNVFFGVFGNQLFIEDDNKIIPLVLEGDVSYDIAPVPLPAGFWLFGSGLIAMVLRLKKA